MQKFTRNLTREIEVAGERLAITFSAEGLSVRPVGSRRPPSTLSWAGCLCATVGLEIGEAEPDGEKVAEALARLKGDRKRPARAGREPEPGTNAEAAPSPAAAAAPAVTPAPASPPAEAPVLAAPATPTTTAAEAEDGLPALLDRLDRWLAQHRPHFAKALLPGATQAQLETLQCEAGVALPEDQQSLLRWHNGQNPDAFGAFVESFYLMSTDQILDVKKDLDAHPPAGWQKAWVPFLDDDHDDHVCVDTAQPGGPVREVWRGREDSPVVAASLTAWVRDFVARLERGEYVEDPERGTFQRRGAS